MELTYSKLDVTTSEAQGHKNLGDIIKRGHANEQWMVPFKAIDFQTPPDWRVFRKENDIYIPVFSYLAPNDSVDALGYAFQLGVRSLHDLGGRPVRRLHVTLGNQLTQVQDQEQNLFFQFYMGLGVVLQ
jgi:hypothetical protein